MPRIKLTKSAIDALSTTKSDAVFWDAASPGFGVKVTPKGRKVFIVLHQLHCSDARGRVVYETASRSTKLIQIKKHTLIVE
jgi:hypothetical protein